MGTPINTNAPGGLVAPRPVPTPAPTPPALPSAPSSLGRDQRQAGGVAPAPAELPDLRDQVGRVSADDLLAVDLEPKSRTAAEVRQAADGLWHEVGSRSVYQFQKVERNAFNVNEDLGPVANMEALQQVSANHGLEVEALAKLSPEQQAQFQDLAKGAERDPMARLALQVLLVEGKLTGGAKATGGGTLLQSLHDVSSKPALEGLDRANLVNDLMQEVALPTAIAQANHGTCTVTAVQIKLARENPAEYARLVGGLASPDGRVTLANGDTVLRDPGSEQAAPTAEQHMTATGAIVAVEVLDPRTDASRLFQSAFMQYGVGDQVTYDPVKDEVSDPRALGPDLVRKVMRGLSNQEVGHLFTDGQKKDGTRVDLRDAVIQEIKAQADQGNSVPVGLRWGEADKSGRYHGYHVITVSQVTNDRVFYDNPWGKQESMSRAEFKKRVMFGQVGSFDP